MRSSIHFLASASWVSIFWTSPFLVLLGVFASSSLVNFPVGLVFEKTSWKTPQCCRCCHAVIRVSANRERHRNSGATPSSLEAPTRKRRLFAGVGDLAAQQRQDPSSVRPNLPSNGGHSCLPRLAVSTNPRSQPFWSSTTPG